MIRWALVVALAFAEAALSPPAGWNNYTNARFAFQICYPNWLRRGWASDNGDGRVFTDKSGGELRTWGSYSTLVLINGKEAESDEAPPSMVISQAADYEAQSLSRVTYRSVHPNWYALSGISKGKIVYIKTIVADDRWITLQLTYPVGAAGKWNQIVKRAAGCLRALPPAQFDPTVKQE